MSSPVASVRSRLSAGKLARFGALAGLALALAGLGGCVSAQQYKDLNSAYEESQKTLAQADVDLTRSRKTIDDLNAEIARLKGLDNNAAYNALKADRDLLAARLADLEAKYNDLLAKAGSMPIVPKNISDRLRDLAAQYPNEMEFDERLGMIRLKTDLTFDKGSTEVSARGKELLAKLARILIDPEIERQELQVVGHTDDIPITGGGPVAQRNPDNWALSTNRAWSVLKILRDDGIRQDRGEAAGWGDQRPLAPNAPGLQGNVLNRRVEIYIRPTTVPENIVVSTGTPRAATPPRPTTPPAASRPASRPATPPAGVPIPRP